MLFRSERYKNLNFLYHEVPGFSDSGASAHLKLLRGEIKGREQKSSQMKGFKCLWLVFYECLSHGNSHLIEHGWVK